MLVVGTFISFGFINKSGDFKRDIFLLLHLSTLWLSVLYCLLSRTVIFILYLRFKRTVRLVIFGVNKFAYCVHLQITITGIFRFFFFFKKFLTLQRQILASISSNETIDVKIQDKRLRFHFKSYLYAFKAVSLMTSQHVMTQSC